MYCLVSRKSAIHKDARVVLYEPKLALDPHGTLESATRITVRNRAVIGKVAKTKKRNMLWPSVDASSDLPTTFLAISLPVRCCASCMALIYCDQLFTPPPAGLRRLISGLDTHHCNHLLHLLDVALSLGLHAVSILRLQLLRPWALRVPGPTGLRSRKVLQATAVGRVDQYDSYRWTRLSI
jgi:hypothetical protein